MAEMEGDNKDEILELDDPRLKEAQTYDPKADKNQYIPPPELDGEGNAIDYRVKLKLGENKLKTHGTYFKLDKKGRPMGILLVEVHVVDPGGIFDNAKLNNEYLNSYLDPRTKASDFTNMARLLGQPFKTGLDLKEQAEILEGLIGGEPQLGARIQWGAYCTQCEQEKKGLSGERKWPEKYAIGEDGEEIVPRVVEGHIPLIDCPDCGSDLTPKTSVKRFMSLG